MKARSKGKQQCSKLVCIIILSMHKCSNRLVSVQKVHCLIKNERSCNGGWCWVGIHGVVGFGVSKASGWVGGG